MGDKFDPTLLGQEVVDDLTARGELGTHRFNVFVDAPDREIALKALGRAIADNNNLVPLDHTRRMIAIMISPHEHKMIPDGMTKP